MLQHSRIIFEMGMMNAKSFGFAIDIGDHCAADDDRFIVLRNLEIARRVGIKIGFAIKVADQIDFGIDGQAELNRFADGLLIENGQRAGLARADDADIGVRFISETIGCGAKKL